MRNFNGRLDRKPNITILASGSGTTAEYLIRATQTGVLQAEVGLVVSNNENAGVFERVEQLNSQYNLNIRQEYISRHTHPGGATEDFREQTDYESAAILEAAQEAAFGRMMVIMMAGYLRKIRGPLLNECGLDWPDEPIHISSLYNSHPGILPDTAGYHGRGVHQRVVDLGLQRSAQVLHGVTKSYDEGTAFKTNLFPVPLLHENASEEESQKLIDRVQEIAQATEKSHLPVDLNKLIAIRKEHLKDMSS
jgi:phosphoribosylglycinamide formyltransferase-1